MKKEQSEVNKLLELFQQEHKEDPTLVQMVTTLLFLTANTERVAGYTAALSDAKKAIEGVQKAAEEQIATAQFLQAKGYNA